MSAKEWRIATETRQMQRSVRGSPGEPYSPSVHHRFTLPSQTDCCIEAARASMPLGTGGRSDNSPASLRGSAGMCGGSLGALALPSCIRVLVSVSPLSLPSPGAKDGHRSERDGPAKVSCCNALPPMFVAQPRHNQMQATETKTI